MLKTLEIIDTLNQYGACSSSTLETMHSVSVATLKRHIQEARSLGADIASLRAGKGWAFELKNGPVVMPLCKKWIELERNRSLIP
jgi:predicted DNA-binding transcriptional regulator YafY